MNPSSFHNSLTFAGLNVVRGSSADILDHGQSNPGKFHDKNILLAFGAYTYTLLLFIHEIAHSLLFCRRDAQ